MTTSLPNLKAIRAHCKEEIASLREDHIRADNATPYKVSVSEELYRLLDELWQREAPIAEIH